MRAGALLLLALAGCSAAPPARGGGIVSTNPCADAMLVRLAPERIAAISHYSQEPGATSMPLAVARRFRATAGTAEEVIALRPALVLTSSFTPPATRDAYRRAGLRTLVLDSPTSVAASEAQVREVAAAVGARARGEAMAGEIEQAARAQATGCLGDTRMVLPARGEGDHAEGMVEGGQPSEYASSPLHHRPLRVGGLPPRPEEKRASRARCPEPPSVNTRPSALLFISGDLATGSGNLLDELLARAGFRNAAAEYGLAFTGRVPIEAIARHPPDVILAPDGGRAAALRRRVLARLGARTKEAHFPRALVNCGGPVIPPVLARLAAIRRTLP